ncbi:MAG: hypothetical protein ACMG6E_10610 [Candidatus Roizmanbacteria bacterium]
MVKNQYSRSMMAAARQFHQPFWGQKLVSPVFYTDEKYDRFMKQWNIKLGLEQIKMKHAIFNVDVSNKKHRNKMKDELMDYISESHLTDSQEKLKDVYVTTHEPKIPKFHTNNEEED